MTAVESKRGKVLIVCYSFPPTSNIAAVRLGKFAKYLPQFGWEPIVLTADKTKTGPQTLPAETDERNIFRTKSFTLSSIAYDSLGGEEHPSPYSLSHAPSKNYSWRKVIHKALKLWQPVYTLPVIERLVLDPIGWYFYAVKEGQRILRSNNIDAIFSSSNPPTAHFVASYLHRKTGIPWIAEFRDPWVDPYDERGRF